MANDDGPFTDRPPSACPTGEAVSPAKLIHLPDKLARVLWKLDVNGASAPSRLSLLVAKFAKSFGWSCVVESLGDFRYGSN